MQPDDKFILLYNNNNNNKSSIALRVESHKAMKEKKKSQEYEYEANPHLFCSWSMISKEIFLSFFFILYWQHLLVLLHFVKEVIFLFLIFLNKK